MIIENAFYKIPEVLMSYDSMDDCYEGNIVNLLMTAVVLEFNIRNIDAPLRLIRNEKIYPNADNQRCDMFVDYTNIYDQRLLNTYYIKTENYIEAKYFGGINRNLGNETKVTNAGKVIFDIYRLLQNTRNSDGKYIFLIFNSPPNRYLAFNRRAVNGLERRKWLDDLLSDGIHEISFNLVDEPHAIRVFWGDVVENVNMHFQAATLSIKPTIDLQEGFWCYLIKICSF